MRTSSKAPAKPVAMPIHCSAKPEWFPKPLIQSSQFQDIRENSIQCELSEEKICASVQRPYELAV